jgi:hypothetical protein
VFFAFFYGHTLLVVRGISFAVRGNFFATFFVARRTVIAGTDVFDVLLLGHRVFELLQILQPFAHEVLRLLAGLRRDLRRGSHHADDQRHGRQPDDASSDIGHSCKYDQNYNQMIVQIDPWHATS